MKLTLHWRAANFSNCYSGSSAERRPGDSFALHSCYLADVFVGRGFGRQTGNQELWFTSWRRYRLVSLRRLIATIRLCLNLRLI